MPAATPARPDPREHDQRQHDQHSVTERLRAELERAEQHVAEAQAEYDLLLADPDVIQEDRDAAATVLGHARRQLESAREATVHLEAGTYGRCVTCGGDIGAERLAALVDVVTCVACAG
jgi:RNA polymerase-binding transcription factor DksA